MIRIWLALVTIPIGFAVSGCSTVGNGGMPAQSGDPKAYIVSLETQYTSATAVAGYASVTTATQRNTIIDGRLAIMDFYYWEFVRVLRSEKQGMDASNDILLIGLGIAGAATKALRAKTNLAVAAVGMGATKAVIDKTYFYEKSVSALIGAMNAQREVARLEILKSRQEDLLTYSMSQADNKLREYYRAGTLESAIESITTDAGVKQQDATDEITKLPVVTEEDIEDRTQLRKTIKSLTVTDLAKMNSALLALGEKTQPPDFESSKARLQEIHRKSRQPEERAALKKALIDASIAIIK